MDSSTKSAAKTYFDNLRKAKQFFNKAAKIKPTTAVYNNLAYTLSLLNKNSEALVVIKKSLDIKRTPNSLVTKGLIQLEMKNLTGALDTANQALVLDSKNIEVLKLKSNIQKAKEEWTGYYETNWLVTQHTEDLNENELAYCNMAESYMNRRNFKQANSILDKYLKDNPTSHTTLHRKFDCAMETKKFSQALALANKMNKIEMDAHSLSLKLRALVKLGKRKESFMTAIKLLNSSDIDPISADLVLESIYVYINSIPTRNKKQIPTVRSACKKAEKKFGDIPLIQDAAAELLNWTNAFTGKEKEFDRLYIKTKKMRREILRRSKKVGYGGSPWTPRFANYDYNYACAFALSGNTDKALQLLGTAIKSNQDYRKIAKKDKDFQNLFELRRFIVLTHEKKENS